MSAAVGEPDQVTAGGDSRVPRLVLAARSYLVIQVVLLFLEGLYRIGLLPRVGTAYLTSPFGLRGLLVNGIAGAAIALLVMRAGHLRRGHHQLLMGFCLIVIPPVLTGLVVGSPLTTRALWIALVSIGVLVSAFISQRNWLLTLAVVGGGLWAWSGVLVAALEIAGLSPFQGTMDPDLDGRYRNWVGLIGVTHVPDQFGALVGLGTSRSVTGGALILLLLTYACALRDSRIQRRRYWLYVALAGVVLGLAWSLSRVAVIGLIAGLLVGSVPWHRITWTSRTVTACFAGPLFTLLAAPLLLAYNLPADFEATDTLGWRMTLWHGYLHLPQIFYPFGRGPEFSLTGISHAHQQALESLGSGGLLGLVALAIALLLLTRHSVRAACSGSPLALASLTATTIYCSFQMVVSGSHYAILSVWFVFIVIMGSSPEPASQTGNSRDAASHD